MNLVFVSTRLLTLKSSQLKNHGHFSPTTKGISSLDLIVKKIQVHIALAVIELAHQVRHSFSRLEK